MSGYHPARRRKWKLFVLLCAVLVFGALAWWMKAHFSLQQLVEQESRLREAISDHPWTSFFLGLAIYTGTSLIPGTGGKAIAFGWLYGFWQAIMIVMIGLTSAAMVIFSLSRYLFRERIERRYERFLTLLNKHLRREGAFYLLTLRMAYVPYSILNPASGASRVGTWTFLWTTFVGVLPGAVISVYVGMRLPSLRELATRGAGSLIDPPLVIALVCCATLPILGRWIISRFGIPGVGDEDHDAATHQNPEVPHP